MSWFVCQTESQREQVAVRWLKEQSFDPYLPCTKVQTIIRQRLVSRLAPLFPSYVFVRGTDYWQPIRRTVAVIDLLLSGDVPAQLGDDVIASIRAQERDGVVQLPSVGLRRDDPVRVIRGPFQGALALYQGMRPRARVEVLLALFGGQRFLTLPRSHIAQV